MINRTVLCGRATRDPETRVTPNGKPVATFTLACERNFKNANGDKETDFIPIVCWGSTANYIGNYLKKGNLIVVDGRLQIRTYEDKDCNKRTIAEVIADSVQNVTSKNERQAVDREETTPPDDLPF